MKSVKIARVETAPKLDGDLSQQVWQKADWYGDFRVLGQPEKKAEVQTSFAMVHDNENLYVAVNVVEPEMELVKAEATGRQHNVSPMDGEDHVEVFVDAEGMGRSCAQFLLSKGALATAWYGPGPLLNTKWRCPARLACQVREAGWVVQLAIPFPYLRFSPDSPTWKGNVTRIRRPLTTDAKPELSTFAPLEGSAFCQPDASATAEVEALDVVDLMWRVKAVGGPRASGEAPAIVYRRRLSISNLANAPRSVQVRCSLDVPEPPTTLELSHEFQPNEKWEQVIEMPLKDEELGELDVAITDTRSSRQVFRNNYYSDSEELSWKEHTVRQSDGKGGYLCRPAQLQLMPRLDGCKVIPFGLATMDNGEIALMGSYSEGGDFGGGREKPVITFSDDGGATWSDYTEVENCYGRPMMLASLGNGVLTYCASDGSRYCRFFSHDYGRTWPDRVPVQPAPDGLLFGAEGNPLVDRDDNGIATMIAETGHTFAEGAWPHAPTREWIRWSRDGGRNWENASQPEAWRWQEVHKGETYTRSVSEGALVRAANGWIVAALRTDMPPRYFDHPFFNDNLEGTGVSISKDNGKTWSQVKTLFDAGRMHANLVRLPDDTLVMTVIRRVDVRDGKLATYRRGCDAVISRDNGQSWETDRMYFLDEFQYTEGENWVGGKCGHLYSIVLADGSVLTAYGNYLSGGTLIKWKP